MAKPFFSIIIPTLNEEKFLPKLLSDLVAQTFCDFEVIIVDAHSEDKTVSAANKIGTKFADFRIIQSGTRHVCVQRNLGAKVALADYLIFMDSDNRLPTYFLQGIKYQLEKNPADIATTFIFADRTYKKGESIAQAMNIAIDIAKNTNKPLISEGMVIIKKSVFNKLGGFDETANYIEGWYLLQKGRELGFSFKIYKDPAYEFSFRRFRKYGLLPLTARAATIEISHLLNIPIDNAVIKKLYPMLGGGIYDNDEARQNRFRHQIENILKNIKHPQRLKQTLTALIK